MTTGIGDESTLEYYTHQKDVDQDIAKKFQYNMEKMHSAEKSAFNLEYLPTLNNRNEISRIFTNAKISTIV